MATQFDKFSNRAREVLVLSHAEAQHFGHSYIGTEHLLLGLVAEGDGVAAHVLSTMGVRPGNLLLTAEFIIGRGQGADIGQIPLTPRAKNAIERAVDEARRLDHDYIGTEHLLLGLMGETDGGAARMLLSIGVDSRKVRHQVMHVVEHRSKADPGDPSTSRLRFPSAQGDIERLETEIEEARGEGGLIQVRDLEAQLATIYFGRLDKREQ